MIQREKRQDPGWNIRNAWNIRWNQDNQGTSDGQKMMDLLEHHETSWKIIFFLGYEEKCEELGNCWKSLGV